MEMAVGPAVIPEPRQPNQILSCGNLELVLAQSFIMAGSTRCRVGNRSVSHGLDSQESWFVEKGKDYRRHEERDKVRLTERVVSMCLKIPDPSRVLPNA